MSQLPRPYLRLLTYLAGFFLALHMALPAYFNSQFLRLFIDDGHVGIIFAIASIITIFLTDLTPSLTKRFGILPTTTIIASVTLLLFFPLAMSTNPLVAVTFFILFYSLGFVLRFLLDVYLEKVSDDRNTGDIRGIFLTFNNIAWVASPFLASTLIKEYSFSVLYFLSALSLIPLIYLAGFKLQEKESHKIIKRESLLKTLKFLLHRRTKAAKDISNILVVDFILNLFYAVMVVYMALYLQEVIGLSIGAIGTVFTIMLLPFVLFELPLGFLADHGWGEKKILLVGLLIMAGATITTAFISSASIVAWAIALFLTRTGAATTEIMKETYLFKKIGEGDIGILSLSRNMQPLSYIIGPLLGSIVISYAGYPLLFYVLGIIVLSGLYFAGSIRDAR